MQEKQTPDIVAATSIFRAARTLSDARFFEAGGWREESHQYVAQAIRDHARARCVLADAHEVDVTCGHWLTWTLFHHASKRSRYYDLARFTCLLTARGLPEEMHEPADYDPAFVAACHEYLAQCILADSGAEIQEAA